ncbi:sigma-70 domain-containing protein [Dorea amylophila]|nr:sigma-70 domain-containing protein [Dorea amylophila]
MIELLKYMEHSTEEVSEQCKSERIQKMHRRVCRIKASEKTEVKYMQAWEEKLLERQKEKRELLRKMNHKMSIEEIADVLDMDVSKVKDIIEEQYDTED